MQKDLVEMAAILQKDLAVVDLLNGTSRSGGNGLELLVLRLDNLKLKIYKEGQHLLPHMHVDYGKVKHAASYRIDPPARLTGNLSNKYDKSVITWLDINKASLLKLWDALQSGSETDVILAELQEDA